MDYLLLICAEQSAVERHADGCGDWYEEMHGRGVLRTAAGLRPPWEATTVRSRGDEIVLFDGPFAETTEGIGGFCMISCKDLDEAIEVAGKHPAARYGSIEIRALHGG